MFTETATQANGAGPVPDAGQGGDDRPWFDLAHALARTGDYRGVDEIEAALRARGVAAAPCRNPIARDAIDIACRRVRGEPLPPLTPPPADAGA
ncbi:hypothetical protein [Sphingosinicella terrae]|uniref:hypothetical protein n=1 Tax=Sphingosinicella terrae TaxID=2172047 RepID=UPI000E0D9147|nr:hypothetical protein [Sphingosinicella terrae]